MSRDSTLVPATGCYQIPVLGKTYSGQVRHNGGQSHKNKLDYLHGVDSSSGSVWETLCGDLFATNSITDCRLTSAWYRIHSHGQRMLSQSHGPTGRVIPCPMKDIPEVLSKADREMATIFLVALAWPLVNWFFGINRSLVRSTIETPRVEASPMSTQVRQISQEYP